MQTYSNKDMYQGVVMKREMTHEEQADLISKKHYLFDKKKRYWGSQVQVFMAIVGLIVALIVISLVLTAIIRFAFF